jgi:hypothetical protein
LRIDLCETGINFACERARILGCECIPYWVRRAYQADPDGLMRVAQDSADNRIEEKLP